MDDDQASSILGHQDLVQVIDTSYIKVRQGNPVPFSLLWQEVPSPRTEQEKAQTDFPQTSADIQRQAHCKGVHLNESQETE